MSEQSLLEQLAGGMTVKPERRLRVDLRLGMAARLARGTFQIPAGIYLAQRAQCFHCGGPLPLFGKALHPGSCSREHALPRGEREDNPRTNGAAVLAHKVCNELRGERPLSPLEWRRAAEVWAIADRLWLEAGQRASPFVIWIELAHQKMEEPT